jgi:hypothetical protein
VELHFDDAIEIAQAGEAGLARKQGGGQQQEQKPFHRELPVSRLPDSFPKTCPTPAMAGRGPVGTPAFAFKVLTYRV